MSKRSRSKKQITSERLQELGFAYAPPLIISAAVSNKVFDVLESGAENGRASQQANRRVGARFAGYYGRARRPRTAEERSKGKIFAHAGERSISHQQQARHGGRLFQVDFASA